MQTSEIRRREFLGGAAASALAFTVVPSHVLGGRRRKGKGEAPPSETLYVASVGAGGRAAGDIKAVENAGGRIVALCDVDERRAARTLKDHAEARKYKDFRVLLDKEAKHVDAVIVATPDHSHASAALAAIRLGKHVYCEKPLTRTVYEARTLTEAARKHKVCTQMGIQAHAKPGYRILVEWVKRGVIGRITEAHICTNRPIWPQGQDRPAGSDPVPKELDWDLWLGPSPQRPFKAKYDTGKLKGKNVYLPFVWRGWWDFGTGAIGDMACHIQDGAFWSLGLTCPTSVEAETSGINAETAPKWSIIRSRYPARAGMPPVTLTWYDGGKRPDPKLIDLPEGKQVPQNSTILIGDKGVILARHGAGPRLVPEEKMKAFTDRPEPSIPPSPGHHKEWVQACKQGKVELALANFNYAGAMTEAVLLGIVAMRAQTRIDYDVKTMKVTNCPEANVYLNPPRRKGWQL